MIGCRLHLNRGQKVRKTTRSCRSFAASVHLLPPNRPWPGIQTTHCTAQSRQASARPHGNSTGSNPAGFQFVRRADMSSTNGHDTSMQAALALVEAAASRPSPADRFNIDREGPAKRAVKTPGAAATIPETERILRRDRRRNSRFARAGAAALVRKKPVPDFPGIRFAADQSKPADYLRAFRTERLIRKGSSGSRPDSQAR